MNTARSIDLYFVVVGSKPGRPAEYDWELSESTIRIIQEDIENSGHRRKCGSSSTARLLNRTENGAICHEEFTDYSDVVPDHEDPKGMGGAWRDDHPDNIRAAHWWCNSEKGSMRD
jgi:hypothetical protein